MSLPLFSKYISEIGGVPLLTPEREAKLGRIIQAGIRPEATEHQKRAGEEAQSELIQKNLKLVVGIAKRFLGGASTLEEMTSDGNQGLTKAATRYNPAFKTRFSTYATWWIREAIQEGLYRAHTIRMPGRRARLLRKIRNSRSFNESARDQDLGRIEEETDIPRETIIRVLNGACTFVSFNAPPHDGEESLEAAIDSGCEDPSMATMRAEESRMALAAMSTLEPIERHVISARFGLNGEPPKTLDGLGQIFGVSHERIRQIEKRALRILKRELAREDVRPATWNPCNPSSSAIIVPANLSLNRKCPQGLAGAGRSCTPRLLTNCKSAMKTFLNITRALADENRLRMLIALREGEVCVCQIADWTGLALSTASKHLSMLYQAGLVNARKEGRWMYYSLPGKGAPTAAREAVAWVRRSLDGNERIARKAAPPHITLAQSASSLAQSASDRFPIRGILEP